MLVSIRGLIIATIPSKKDEAPHVAFSKRYPTVDLRGKRLCSLHGTEWFDLPSDDHIVEEVLQHAEHEFILTPTWGPVIQLRKNNFLYLAVPLTSHLEPTSSIGLSMVPTASCITTLETISTLHSMLVSKEKDNSLKMEKDCTLFDLLSVYVSTTIPLGSVGDELSPSQFLRKFNYSGNPCSPTVISIRQVEYIYGETNCGSSSYPSIWGCLEADVDTATPVTGKVKIAGHAQDLSVDVAKVTDDQELPEGHEFTVRYSDGVAQNLCSYSSPAPSAAPVKGSFKAYMPKTVNGIADVRFSLSFLLNPLESERKKCSSEVTVTFNFGTARSVASHTLVPSSGIVQISTINKVKTLVWKIPKNRRLPDSTLTGKCTFIAAKDGGEGSTDHSAPFISGVNCYADVAINAVGYQSSSGVSLSSATISEGTISVLPPVLRSSGFRI
eukprot:TRINITY_DN1347_c0_g1_i4.p1 TRINITY_DN1347_c0_g1~~TRINITY_DN1347_c0_g1_i4.p1  ORF type:complete len:466 (+),score=67.27 TRINITY_DN1347_c0_g1_i4:76-1398(+)